MQNLSLQNLGITGTSAVTSASAHTTKMLAIARRKGELARNNELGPSLPLVEGDLEKFRRRPCKSDR